MMHFHPKDRKEWRDWLSKNHDKESVVHVIKYKKHTGKPYIAHLELMHEAICFGWIDTTVKGLDGERYMVCFRKRTDKARWSSNTLAYAKKMIAEGLMTPAGLKRYKEGLQKPTLDYGMPKNPAAPADLKKALGKHLAHFNSLAPSYKSYYVRWLLRAKRPETRTKRIREIVKNCEQGKRKLI